MSNNYVRIKNYIKPEEIEELVNNDDSTYDPENSDDSDENSDDE